MQTSILAYKSIHIYILSTFLFLISCEKQGEAPSVTTLEANDINEASVICGGTVTSDGGSSVTARGLLLSATNTSPDFTDYVITNGEGLGSFTIPLTGLPTKTTYYACAFASNFDGTGYGNVISFTISYDIITTTAVSNISPFHALSGGNVATAWEESVIERGICWDTSPYPLITGNHTSDSSGSGIYESHINDLTENTLYYVRAYVRAYVSYEMEIIYGNQVSFTTIEFSGGQPCPNMPTVHYEGKTYNTVQIGAQCWFKENLNVGVRINESQDQIATNGIMEKHCYDDLESNCDIFGGLYQWDEMMQGSTTPGVQGLCPSGWHIPTDIEWTTLTDYLGGDSVAGGRLKELGTTHWQYPNEGATNESGFSALPGGLRNNYYGSYSNLTELGYWWSSVEKNEEYFLYGWNIVLGYHVSYFFTHFYGKSKSFSVRCLKN
jgi:uncharacterized protein (TIGR02145 family)